MTRRSKNTILLVAALILLLITVRLIRTARSEAQPEGVNKLVPVDGFVVKPQSFTRKIEESGTLRGNRESLIAAEVGGRVLEIYVEAGDKVKAGEPLIRLDDELLGLESDRAKIAFDKAKLDFDRVSTLHDQKSVSDSDLENARLGMKAAEVQYRLALKSYRDGTVRAPFSGSVAARLVEIGQTIERGMPVASLVDLSAIKVTVQVSENDISSVALGASALVVVESLEDTVSGSIFSIGARASEGARTFPVDVKLPGGEDLKSGLFARVIIQGSTVNDALLVPRSATLPDMGRTVVYTAHNGTAQKVVAGILGAIGDRVAVSGILPGDTIIVTGNQMLSQGTPITLTMRSE